MASNKECLIIVLDVRTCAAEEVKLKSAKCVAEIIKDKIVCDKKDFVSFVLVGCDDKEKETQPNVVPYGDPQLCNWHLLLEFFKFVNKTACEEGQWLDGLQAALKLQETALSFKPARRRILLLFDFNDFPQDYDKFNEITDYLLKENIDLIVGTHNIAYKDNAETDQPQAIFNFSRKCGAEELENQKHVLSLVPRCNATLCSFKEALLTVFKVTNRRPWVWNAKLHIGSKICISLQGMIAMKNQTPVKLTKVWAEKDETVTRETRHFIKGSEVTPLPEDLMAGYMLGGTPVPYDADVLEPKEPFPPGLHFFGFIKRNAVPDEYYCGDSLYLLVHQKNNKAAAVKLDALVRALISSDRAIICWKIFSTKFNRPQMVVLLPRLADDTHPATLYMLEVSYTSQHHFWDFPSLRTSKTQCSEDQLQAIDELIDSTDLECTLRDTQQPRPWAQNDLLPFDGLPSIFEQNVMDILERKVIWNDDRESEMLKEKNFVDVFWRVPEPLEEKSKRAAANVKKLFPLRYSRAWQEKLLAKEQAENGVPVKQEPAEKEIPMPSDGVGLTNPGSDFTRILASVRSIANATQRDARFLALAADTRVVILTLLERKKLNCEQLGEIIALYRQSCMDFNTFQDYDKFAEELKKITLAKKHSEFWQDVVVEKQLGPLVMGELTLDDELALKAFYTIENWQEKESNETEDVEN
ncbi:X-ray repair cross-complementing protein 5 [Drosophila suzukii]|uniref:ATP-dependent DNA helicase II subunit 2 n=1 Tax=Drosophila suzukii TaxID=28584 RepID=A0AB39YYF1_DROSZ